MELLPIIVPIVIITLISVCALSVYGYRDRMVRLLALVLGMCARWPASLRGWCTAVLASITAGWAACGLRCRRALRYSSSYVHRPEATRETLATHTVRNQSMGDARNQSTGSARNQSMGDARNQSTGSARNQSTGSARNQSTEDAWNQSTGGARNQSTGGARNQSTGGARNQSTGGARNQSMGSAKNQSTGGTLTTGGLANRSPREDTLSKVTVAAKNWTRGTNSLVTSIQGSSTALATNTYTQDTAQKSHPNSGMAVVQKDRQVWEDPDSRACTKSIVRRLAGKGTEGTGGGGDTRTSESEEELEARGKEAGGGKSDDAHNKVQSISSNMPSNPIRKEDLEDYLNHAIRSGVIDDEFQNIPPQFNKPTTVAVLPCNRPKNRYKNNLPYDDTRVVLEDNPDGLRGDYINASYIRSYKKSKGYIATQGPKDFNVSTMEDFWRMVWENNTNIIVMLAKLIEGGRVKVSQYWPAALEEEVPYGDIFVKLVTQEDRLDCVQRLIMVSCGDEIRELVHYQFTSWPDHDVPQTPYSFALMVHEICKWKRTGPVVVHCSAGLGRTGTLLLVLTLVDQLTGSGQLDAPGGLVALRLGRPNLIENQAQYRFCHQVLLELLFGETTSYPVAAFPHHMERIVGNLKDEYLKLKNLPRDLTYKWGENPAHAHMNRHQHILPVDGRQVFLQMICGRPESQYVNAVRVNGVTQRDAVIVTEHPLPCTLAHVWRMMYERKVCAWVILHHHPHHQQEEYPSVLPSGGEVEMDHVMVKVENVTNHHYFTDTCVTIFPVSSRMSLPLQVNVLHLLDWDADEELPAIPLPLLLLLEHLHELRKLSPASLTAITCSDGYSASGVVAALDLILSKVRLQGEVDIYRAVQGILFDRPQFITSLEQYVFLHEATATYILMLDTKEEEEEEGVHH
ncbi:receptor-type tyrosine-protein phosphatase epsilon [Procambarus clarkii]|uniref:receptor-type tyrosine-protein phosphatase epsilon n=1 Tax=Procambarus clarkii TaxID=6728 RepID=UPI0037436B90